MKDDISDCYFEWLCDKVPCMARWRESALKALYDHHFVAHVHGDDNRASYGLLVRDEFIDNYAVHFFSEDQIRDLEDVPCNCFETIWALAKQCEEQACDILPYNQIGWFDLMASSIFTLHYRKQSYDECRTKLSTFVNRKYTENGIGSLFPLRKEVENYQNMEIWYQFHAFLRQL